MRSRSALLRRLRVRAMLAIVCSVLAFAAEIGHAQWTLGGPSGARGPRIAFGAGGIATWRESGVSVFRGAIAWWTTRRSVHRDGYAWGDGGPLFFGVHDGLGGPGADDGSVRWLPRVGVGGAQLTGAVAGAERAWFVSIPLWPCAALALLAAAVTWRRGRVSPGACAACGYDRRGLDDRPCPECGLGAAA